MAETIVLRSQLPSHDPTSVFKITRLRQGIRINHLILQRKPWLKQKAEVRPHAVAV